MNALEFYERNKHYKWQPPPIPNNLIEDIDIAKWLLNVLDFGWIKLDLEIEIEKWKQECKFAEFTGHRGLSHSGWNSCCIHGIDVDKTESWAEYGYKDEKDVPYKWTKISVNTPTIKNFWTEKFPSTQYRRIRFMELAANGYIDPHNDKPGELPGEENFDALSFGVPVNIAIIHPEECHMVLEGKGIVPFTEGSAFIINIRHTHSFINFSNSSRIHIIGHSFGYGDKLNDFAALVVKSYKKQYELYSFSA